VEEKIFSLFSEAVFSIAKAIFSFYFPSPLFSKKLKMTF